MWRLPSLNGWTRLAFLSAAIVLASIANVYTLVLADWDPLPPPITVDQMFAIAATGGQDSTGAPYLAGGGRWNPDNWSEVGADCSGFVAKVWQVSQLAEVTRNLHEISTANLYCYNQPAAYWEPKAPQEAQRGDALTNDEPCQAGLSVHTVLYESGTVCDLCTVWVWHSGSNPTGGAGIRHRQYFLWVNEAPYDYSWVVRRRKGVAEPGIVGRQDANGTPRAGFVHQRMIDAYFNNGGRASVGVPIWNGGGVLAYSWGPGIMQDMDSGTGGRGALMAPNAYPDKAFWVHGDIWNTYAANGEGAGWMGYPIAPQYSRDNGCFLAPRQDFQNGYISQDCDGQYRAHNYPEYFVTGWESGQPTGYLNRLEYAVNVAGYFPWVPPEAGLRSAEMGVPIEFGSYYLMMAGRSTSNDHGYAYYRVFDNMNSSLPVTVRNGMRLRWHQFNYQQVFMAVDVHFTDGSVLRDTGFVDQNNRNVHPAARGDYWTGSWMYFEVDLAQQGGLAVGKTIDYIMVAYDRGYGIDQQYRAYVDELSISY